MMEEVPIWREFRLKVQVVSDAVECLSLIEQIFKIYPSVDKVSIGKFLVDANQVKP